MILNPRRESAESLERQSLCKTLSDVMPDLIGIDKKINTIKLCKTKK